VGELIDQNTKREERGRGRERKRER